MTDGLHEELMDDMQAQLDYLGLQAAAPDTEESQKLRDSVDMLQHKLDALSSPSSPSGAPASGIEQRMQALERRVESQHSYILWLESEQATMRQEIARHDTQADRQHREATRHAAGMLDLASLVGAMEQHIKQLQRANQSQLDPLQLGMTQHTQSTLGGCQLPVKPACHIRSSSNSLCASTAGDVDEPVRTHGGVLGVYCIGGGSSASSAWDSFEMYDAHSAGWSVSSKRMQLPRMSHMSAAIGDKIYVIGGGNGSERYGSGEVFNISTKAWSAVAPMAHARSGFATLVVGNTLMVLGGLDAEQVFQSVELYQPEKRKWVFGPALGIRRFGMMAAVTLGDSLIVAGGSDGTQALDSVEVIDSDLKGDWSLRPEWKMPTARLGGGAAVLNGKLFLAGGTDGSAHLDLVECFDPATEVWSKVTPMLHARSSCGVVAFDGKLMVCGGYNGESRSDECETLDPEIGCWVELAAMNCQRSGASLIVAPVAHPTL